MSSCGVLGQKKMISEIFDFFRRFDEILDAKNSDFLECTNEYFCQKSLILGKNHTFF